MQQAAGKRDKDGFLLRGEEVSRIEAFVDADAIDIRYFEKPYVLVPGKKAEKGYVLLRETLVKSKKIGVARVVIRTREYLSVVMPLGDALVLVMMRIMQTRWTRTWAEKGGRARLVPAT